MNKIGYYEDVTQGALDVVRWFDVIQDSVTDNTIAMENAVLSGQHLYIPSSDDMVYLSGPLPAMVEGQQIIGASPRASILRWSGTGYDAITFEDEGAGRFGGGLRNLGIRHAGGGGEPTSHAAVRVNRHSRLFFHNLEFNNWYKNLYFQYANFIRGSHINFFAPTRTTMMHSLIHIEGSDFAQTTNFKFWDIDGKGEVDLDPFVDKAIYIQDLDYGVFSDFHLNLTNNPIYIDERVSEVPTQINTLYFSRFYCDENHNGVDVRAGGNDVQICRDFWWDDCYFRKTLNGYAMTFAPSGGMQDVRVTRSFFAFNDQGAISAGGAQAAANLSGFEFSGNTMNANNRNYDENGNVGTPAEDVVEVSIATRGAIITNNKFDSQDFETGGKALQLGTLATENYLVAGNDFRKGNYETPIDNLTDPAECDLMITDNWDNYHGETLIRTEGMVTPTVSTVWTKTLAEGDALQVFAEVIIFNDAHSATNGYFIHGVFSRDDGGAAQQGGATNDIAVAEDAATGAAAFVLSTNDVLVNITPPDAGTWTAETKIRWRKVRT